MNDYRDLIIKTLDFSQMRFRVDLFDLDKNIVFEYPELVKQPIFRNLKAKDSELFVRYVILMYSPESPIVQKWDNKLDRMHIVLDYLGVNRENLRKEESIKLELPVLWVEIYNNENIKVNELIQCYLNNIVCNLEYRSLIAYEDLWEDNLEKIKQFEESDDKSKDLDDATKKYKLIEQNEELLKKIKNLKDIVYLKDKKLAKDIHRKKMITPENHVRFEP